MEEVDEVSAITGFLRDFVPDKGSSPTGDPDNIQLRSSIVGGYRLLLAEIEPEILDWITHYLEQRNCPYKLAIVLADQVADEIKASLSHCENGDDQTELDYILDSTLLYNSVLEKLSELCNRYRNEPEEVLKKTSLVQSPHYKTSISAIKNSRRKMEDRHVEIHDLNAVCGLQNMPPQSYYAIFDGHAGIEAASYAAAHLHFNIARHPDFASDVEKAMKEAFMQTDNDFVDRAKRENIKSGCTAVCCLIRDNALYVGWLGDSQAVLVRSGHPISLVEPHKPDKESERERILSMGGFVSFLGIYRVNGTLAVSRAIGDPDYKPFVSAEADLRVLPMDGTEDFLVLGCDGLWDRLSPQDMALTVYHHVSEKKQSLETCAAELVQLSKEQGSLDNITGIVVFFKNPQDIDFIVPDSPTFTFASNPVDAQNGNADLNSFTHNNPFKPSWADNPTGSLESGKSIYVYNSGLTVGDPIGSNGPEEIFRPFTGVTLEKTAISELPTPPIEDLVALEHMAQREANPYSSEDSTYVESQNAQDIAAAILDSAKETAFSDSPLDNMPESNVDDEPDSSTFINLGANPGSLDIVPENIDFIPQAKPWMLQVQHSVHQNEVDYLPNPDSADFLQLQQKPTLAHDLPSPISQNPFELGGKLEEIPLESGDNGLADLEDHDMDNNNPFSTQSQGYSNEGFLQDPIIEGETSNYSEEAPSTLRALHGIQEMIGISETVPGSKAPEPAGMLLENPFNSQKEVYSAFEDMLPPEPSEVTVDNQSPPIMENVEIITPAQSIDNSSTLIENVVTKPAGTNATADQAEGVIDLLSNDFTTQNAPEGVSYDFSPSISTDDCLERDGSLANQQHETQLEELQLSEKNLALADESLTDYQNLQDFKLEDLSQLESTLETVCIGKAEPIEVDQGKVVAEPIVTDEVPVSEPTLNMSAVADLLGSLTIVGDHSTDQANILDTIPSFESQMTSEILSPKLETPIAGNNILEDIILKCEMSGLNQEVVVSQKPEEKPSTDLMAQPTSIAVLAPILSMETLIPVAPAAAEDTLTAPVVRLDHIPDGVPEADGVTEDVDSDSEKDGGWSYVRGSQKTLDDPEKNEPPKPSTDIEQNLDTEPRAVLSDPLVTQDTLQLVTDIIAVNDESPIIPQSEKNLLEAPSEIEKPKEDATTKPSKPLATASKTVTKTLTTAATKLSKTEDKTKLKPSPSAPKASPIKRLETGTLKPATPSTPKASVNTMKKTPSSSTPKMVSKSRIAPTTGITKLPDSKPAASAKPSMASGTLKPSTTVRSTTTAPKDAAITKTATMKKSVTATVTNSKTSTTTLSSATSKPTGTLRTTVSSQTSTMTRKVVPTLTKAPSRTVSSASTEKRATGTTSTTVRPATSRPTATKTASSTLARPSTAPPPIRKPVSTTQTLPSRGAPSSKPKPALTAASSKTLTLASKVTKESANKNIISKNVSSSTASVKSTIMKTTTTKTSGATTKSGSKTSKPDVQPSKDPKPIKRPTPAAAKVDPKENGAMDKEAGEQIKPISIIDEPEKPVESKATGEEKFSIEEHTKELQAVDSGLASPESPESPQNGLVHHNGTVDKVDTEPITQ